MSNEPAKPPVSAFETLEKMSKLSKARVTATSPQRRVRVTLQDSKYSVEIRPEGFQQLSPDTLADEVVHGVYGTLRGLKRAKHEAMREYQASRPPAKPTPEADVRHMQRAQETVSITATSPAGLVRGKWAAVGGLTLKINAVNESFRVALAGELAAILTELSTKFAAEMSTTNRQASRRLPSRA